MAALTTLDRTIFRGQLSSIKSRAETLDLSPFQFLSIPSTSPTATEFDQLQSFKEYDQELQEIYNEVRSLSSETLVPGYLRVPLRVHSSLSHLPSLLSSR